jgi:hypothetical protein
MHKKITAIALAIHHTHAASKTPNFPLTDDDFLVFAQIEIKSFHNELIPQLSTEW